MTASVCGFVGGRFGAEAVEVQKFRDLRLLGRLVA